MNNKKQLDFQTIAVDFDGTLCYSKWPELGQSNQALIEYLQEWKRNGNKLILWTCRAGKALSKGKYVIIRICPQLYFSDTLFS